MSLNVIKTSRLWHFPIFKEGTIGCYYTLPDGHAVAPKPKVVHARNAIVAIQSVQANVQKANKSNK
jgi:hypothetical protein